MPRENKSRRREAVDENNQKYREYRMKKAAVFKIAAFFVLLCTGAVVSLMLPLRPKVSQNEKRMLEVFPQFTSESLLDGTYFAQVDAWFSDTFPFRDELIACSEKMTAFYGFRSRTVHGKVVAGDVIPEVEMDVDALNQAVNLSGNDAAGSVNTHLPGPSEEELDAENIGTSVEDTDGTTKAQSGERLGAVFVVKDSAYNYYAFSQNNSDRYVDVINTLGDSLTGKAALYDLIVPTSMDIALDDATRNSLTSSSQKKAILYMYSRMSSRVNKTYVYDLLKLHRNEYLYFRTDHHWTALGAYYAYGAFMRQMGKTPHALEEYEKLEFPGFKGTFYTQTGAASLGGSPDTVYAYQPLSTNRMKMLDSQGNWIDYNIITDVSDWSASSKYNTFIGGDNAYSEFHNPALSDGSACLVVKESFGNAFAPYLTDHFEDVYVIDYRYYEGTVSSLVEEYGIDTVLVINNVAATSTQQRVSEMERVCR